MRRAVIFTGALRTIKKTIAYFKQNVLLDAEVDVFACVQNDTSQPEEEWTTWFKEQMGTALRSIEWFSLQKYPSWVTQRDIQLQRLTIEDRWKDYLRHSGSIIEYFQLQLAYMNMCQYEQKNGFLYEYVIRGRTDTIFAKPVDFHWLSWSEEEVAARVERIKEELELSKMEITNRSILNAFMSTLLSDDLIPNIERILTDNIVLEPEPVISAAYLQSGRYIVTIRKNNLYIVRRDLFYLIPTLGSMYGFLRAPNSDDYWFNAEGQFRAACYYSHLSVYDYDTRFDGRSLEYAHLWKEADFFDTDYRLINPAMLYCVVRK
jgi:hypothetical protein